MVCYVFARKFAAYLRAGVDVARSCQPRPAANRPTGTRRTSSVVSLLLILGPIELVVLVPSLGAAV